jgi:hypothetical protein
MRKSFIMKTILEAKKRLADRLRDEEGFVGVGIGYQSNEEALRVYVIDSHFPVAQRLRADGQFEGYPIEIEVTGEVRVSAS